MHKHRCFFFVCMIIAALVIVLYAINRFFTQSLTQKYFPSGEVLYNPMTGFAPPATSHSNQGDNTLVYVDVTFRELEPEEGVFAFDAIREQNQLDLHREAGRKVVFRFICDLPGEEDHIDISDWLYDRCSDGTHYNCPYGKGYSPNYENPEFIAAHREAIAALGREFGQDDFFCFIELGSLGHWGEWHVHYPSGISRFPSEEICRQYVEPYIEAFPNSLLLMRRPFALAKEYNLGVFNDMTGHQDATWTWLDWINEGGIYDEPVRPIPLAAQPEIWKHAPVGGEFTSSLEMENMLNSNLPQTIELLQSSHMTFIGPHSPRLELRESCGAGMDKVLKTLGYRYGITQIQLTYNKLLRQTFIGLTVKNHGTAPMYRDWPMYLTLEETGREPYREKLPIQLSELAQDQETTCWIRLPCHKLDKNGIRKLFVAIENPATGLPAVAMDMDIPQENRSYLLFTGTSQEWIPVQPIDH